MIRIIIRRDPKGYITEFIAEGHAGYKEKGEDIVCAGVSAITGTAIIGLERVIGIKPILETDTKKGYLRCKLPEDVPAEHLNAISIILETMVLSLKDISNQYKKFVKVLDKEV